MSVPFTPVLREKALKYYSTYFSPGVANSKHGCAYLN